jgi:hypothetical protein
MKIWSLTPTPIDEKGSPLKAEIHGESIAARAGLVFESAEDGEFVTERGPSCSANETPALQITDNPMNQPNNRVHNHLGLILTPGTQVVTLVEVNDGDRLLHPVGAVAVIVKAPTDLEHAYRVRFIDGFEAALKSHELGKHKGVRKA